MLTYTVNIQASKTHSKSRIYSEHRTYQIEAADHDMVILKAIGLAYAEGLELVHVTHIEIA